MTDLIQVARVARNARLSELLEEGFVVDETIMADCIGADVQTLRASRFGRQPVQTYVTGGWPVEWSDYQIHLFIRHIRTAQSPVAGIDDISNARELDVETGAATPADWPEFYNSRTDQARATCYLSLSTFPDLVTACYEAGIPLPPRIRFAWWWKNEPGVPLPDDEDVPAPEAGEVLAELERLTGLTVPVHVLWACQFANYARWDLSKVYGRLDYARR